MRTPKSILLYIIAAVWAVASCTENGDQGLQTVEMPIQIAIPAGDLTSTRAYGDPGTWERFRLPRYLYLFLVTSHTSGGVTVTSVQRPLDNELAANKWEKRLGSETSFNVTGSDSLYVYTGDIHVMLPRERTKGEVYCAVSPVPLSISDHGYPQTRDAVLNATFSFSPDAQGSYDFLKDIYTSPHNLKNTSGSYYATVSDYTTDYPQLSLVLYHVAARLDLDWNVAPAIQSQMSLTSMKVAGLKQNDCLLFRPMENTAAGSSPYEYTVPINIGNQWYGRHYFYVIPYYSGGNYPIQLKLRKAGGTGEHIKDIGIQTTAAPAVFTPWMYGNIAIENVWTE